MSNLANQPEARPNKTGSPKRRQFIKTLVIKTLVIKTLATAAAAPMIVPSSALGLDGHTAPSERITMGLIGCGGHGTGGIWIGCLPIPINKS